MVTNGIARAFNVSGATQAVALDISKALERFCHVSLFHKGKASSISGKLFHLISSFLSSKRLFVVLDGKTSSKYTFNAGVPQDLILGLSLFLLYINNLPDDILRKIAI